MALLTIDERKKRFEFLGLGSYNNTSLLKFQKKAFPNKENEWDSTYGAHTDHALRTFYNVKKYGGGYFQPAEFKCNCGKCSGYPSYMKKVEIEHLTRIRKHYGKPMTITSGLRCGAENSRVGGVPNSGHTKGYAADFYMAGVTDTVKHRESALKWIVKQPNHEFTYGANMKDSNGLYRTATSMGNAMHTETHKPIKTVYDKMCEWAKKIAKDDSFHYVFYSVSKVCPICHNVPKGKKHGGNCIWYAWASWHHGAGLKSKCACDAMTDQLYERVLNSSATDALKIVQNRIGLKDIKVIKNKKGIALSNLKKGDIIVYFVGNDYKHTALYLGDGKIADCTSTRKDGIKYGVKSYTGMSIKVAVRYMGR